MCDSSPQFRDNSNNNNYFYFHLLATFQDKCGPVASLFGSPSTCSSKRKPLGIVNKANKGFHGRDALALVPKHWREYKVLSHPQLATDGSRILWQFANVSNIKITRQMEKVLLGLVMMKRILILNFSNINN